MQYYEDYFDEAGPERTAGYKWFRPPERVASLHKRLFFSFSIIKAGLDNQFDHQDIEYSERDG